MKKLIKHQLPFLFSALLILTVFSTTSAEVKLPQVISSHMVIQRNADIKLWGWAEKGETVKISFNNITRTGKATKEGKWTIVFPAMNEGGPYEMVIQGRKNKITLNNIMLGDVWICSGQSNMEWPVVRSDNPEEEIKNADFPNIRLLTIHRNAQLSPVDEVPSTEWKICTPENIPDFSAVGYFFGRKVHTETNVPIGLINTSWGGTNVEAWTSKDYMEAYPEYKDKLVFLNTTTPEELKKAENIRYNMLEKEFNIKKGDIPVENWADPKTDLTHWKTISVPGAWEDRGLSGIDGVVWFRKEFELTPEQSARNLLLALGRIDDSDIAWVNGKEVGRTLNNSDLLRNYPVNKDMLKPGKNEIVVKITDSGDLGGFRSGGNVVKLTGEGINISLDGNWRFRISGENLIYTHGPMGKNEIPSQLFNGMINPLLNLRVKGAIWYQGESNASRAYRYRELFPNLINNWRKYWNQPDMAFIFVQLANFMAVDNQPVESTWAELREAQLMTLSLPYTGMAVAIDIGEANDIHPRNKQDVGLRLALNALKISYGKEVVSMGPVFKSMEITGNKIYLSFDHMGTGLKSNDKYGYLKGFSIAGKDKKFVWARAWIEGDKVVVWSPETSSPVAVRYGWANNPDDVNLYNNEGLPATPFRTDNWDGLTTNKVN